MSLLTESVAGILGDLCAPDDVAAAERDGWAPRLWAALAGAGLTGIGVPEEAGGSGGDLADALEMLTTAGRFAVPLPLVETGILGGWAMAAAGLPVPAGPVTAARPTADLRAVRTLGRWRLDGRLDRVPWAAHAERVVIIAGDLVVAFHPSRASLVPGRNLAGEPRDTLLLDGVTADEAGPAPATAVDFLLRGALGRAAQMAGAMARVRDLTVRYTGERQQFGRPVARFQAVGQHLVRIAEEAVLADMAVQAAAPSSGATADGGLAAAAAKIVAGQAATAVAAAAHQAHGAIGMTREYELGQLTRRLWAWRDEYGSESYWSTWLGDRLAGGDLWPALAGGA
jgi:acyl-CoA dehydrogenase